MTAPAAYSASQQASVANLLAVPVWAEGTRNSDGLPFYSFSSSTQPGIIYHTRQDGRGCTCPGARKSRAGMCAHRIATIERQNEESLAGGLASDSEVDVVASGIATDARARDEALRRRRQADDVFERLFGRDGSDN